ncbi:hypothetical protein, partial [Stenotrophomonas maltophilia]|uniref:hypothetical protein n=1 Tax=Stenotrophomonas maltophilia TaxID=40324 RepID=UPI0031451261
MSLLGQPPGWFVLVFFVVLFLCVGGGVCFCVDFCCLVLWFFGVVVWVCLVVFLVGWVFVGFPARAP